jgi:hypothetical protein
MLSPHMFARPPCWNNQTQELVHKILSRVCLIDVHFLPKYMKMVKLFKRILGTLNT